MNIIKPTKTKSYHSSVEKKGRTVTQIIHFSGGGKKTFRGVITSSIIQGEFTQFELIDGRRIYINTANVNFFEVIPEQDISDKKYNF